MDLIWRDLSENDEHCTRLQLYSETDPGTAATFAVRCNSIIGVTSEENFSNDAMYLVEGVFPDNHTLQQVEMDWSFLQPLALEERQALIQGVSSIPSIQHISIRGGCNVAATALAAAHQQQPVIAAAAAVAVDGDDTSQQTTTSSSSSLQASVLNLSMLTLIPERAHATLMSLSIEMAELTISNLNDLKLAANAFAQCHELESLHIRGLFLVLPQANDTNSNNHENDNDDNETGHDDNHTQQQQQQQQLQQQQPQHAGCYDVLLQALATLPKFHILHMSQKEDPNKPPSTATTTIDSTTTDAASSLQYQQQATITCDALATFCRATISRLTCLSLLNMGLQDEHCTVLKQELNTSTCLTSLILIDNPSITESGNALLLQLLKQNRSIFNSTFGTDSDTQYRTQQLTFLHLNRCGRCHYKISDNNDDATTDSLTKKTSRPLVNKPQQQQLTSSRQVNKPQQQQQQPEQGWIQYLTKINETVPEELELDALYCAILENPDFIRHATCSVVASLSTDADVVDVNKTVHKKKSPVDDEVKVHKNNKPSVVHDPLTGTFSSSSPPPSSPTIPESAIPSIITMTTNPHHHHSSSASSSLKKNKASVDAAVATLDQHHDVCCKDKDSNPVVMDTTTTPTESTCSSVDDAVSDLSFCGVEDSHERDHDECDDDDDQYNEDNEQNDAQEKDHNDAVARIWPGSHPPPRPSQLDQNDASDDAAEKTNNKDKQQQQDAYYMNQFRRLESKLAQRERQLWLREQALQTRMRHVLNREAELLQAEERIKEANMQQEQNNNAATTKHDISLQQQEQQGGLFFLPALFNTGTNNNKSQHRVKAPQKTKMTPPSQHYQAESEYCDTGLSPKTIIIKEDSCLAVTRASAYSLQPQDSSSSSLEGRDDDDVQQKLEQQQHVVTGPSATSATTAAAAAAAAMTTLPGLCRMSSSSSSQSVSSLFLDFEKQTIATLEQVRDECWNLTSVSSFFQ